MEATMQLNPFGYVERSDRSNSPGQFFDPKTEAVIVIDPVWESALTGLEEYPHLNVLFWFDRSERPASPPPLRPAEGREELPPVGLFAIRTPRRPNPIGLSVVRLHWREGNRLLVTGFGAWHGTPVLDLKGYNDRDDVRPGATQPAWLERLWAVHDAER